MFLYALYACKIVTFVSKTTSNIMKKQIYLLLVACLISTGTQAQVSSFWKIDMAAQRYDISPNIYGLNPYVANAANHVGTAIQPTDLNEVSRRIGGDRATTYNWENNFSTSGNYGAGYDNMADTWYPWNTGVPSVNYGNAGAVPIQFQIDNLSLNRPIYSVYQLNCANYVAADGNGLISVGETAPSARWKQEIVNKGAALSLNPDLNDNFVYKDEELNKILYSFGPANFPNGVKAYTLDNEPGLWHSTHPRMHPVPTTCAEVVSKNVELATMIKTLDTTAEVFGPSMYGFSEFVSLQSYPGAADFSFYNQEPFTTNNTGDQMRYNYMTWINGYLSEMKTAEILQGKRMVDGLDLHWYPEARGFDNNGNPVRICDNGNANRNDAGVAQARMQAPRSLWDPTYIENSWITNDVLNQHAIQLLPKVNLSISDFYPNTKLAFTEYDFGGHDHISGGIAQADVFGIFGKNKVYLSNFFAEADGYIASAFKIYRNYNGQNATFGDVGIPAIPNNQDFSVYAAVNGSNDNELHIIIINKTDAAKTAPIEVKNGTVAYQQAEVWGFDQNNAAITQRAAINNISSNSFSYTVPAYSVLHFILKDYGVNVANPLAQFQSLKVKNNPIQDKLNVSIQLNNELQGKLEILDIQGKILSQITDLQGEKEMKIDFLYPAGMYILRLITEKGVISQKLVK